MLETVVRSANCPKNDNIVYIGNLIQKDRGAENAPYPPEASAAARPERDHRKASRAWACISAMSIVDWPPDNIEDFWP